MNRLLNTLATSGALVVLMAGLWQDWSLMTTLKRMLITYLGSYILGSVMALTVKIVPLFERKVEPKVNQEESQAQDKQVLT